MNAPTAFICSHLRRRFLSRNRIQNKLAIDTLTSAIVGVYFVFCVMFAIIGFNALVVLVSVVVNNNVSHLFCSFWDSFCFFFLLFFFYDQMKCKHKYNFDLKICVQCLASVCMANGINDGRLVDDDWWIAFEMINRYKIYIADNMSEFCVTVISIPWFTSYRHISFHFIWLCYDSFRWNVQQNNINCIICNNIKI